MGTGGGPTLKGPLVLKVRDPDVSVLSYPTKTVTANLKKSETGFRTVSAGIPHTLLYRIEALGCPTVGLLF